jgi:hypothetical protein
VLEQGKAADIVCHSGSVRIPGEPLDYGQHRQQHRALFPGVA